ncbi:CRP-like cAMP-binding protein [Mycoplana sp. BE70]|uniref:helix-turn-helix domain-containing protein n=1 Tax=Mycoplana sp. BE70 TaxID=2817775 RepID=UPI002862F641|nr:helix-turn-helix domain-containing protein [Mycoplana sp. BE70]MDR6755818.1 CRP-like cAMP-binding protein [Mycoplana sp. BE70]
MATALLDLANQFPCNGPDAGGNTLSFKLHLTRADLADWLGMTLETVSRCLNDFKRSGLIEFDRPSVITILKRDILLSIASGRHDADETEGPMFQP